MEFRTYDEFYKQMTEGLPSWEIILGTTKKELAGNTCFITQRGSDTAYADGVPFIASTTYDVIFLQKRAVFNNREILEIMDNGVDFNLYDEDSQMNIFTGQVTLYGPGSVPNDGI